MLEQFKRARHDDMGWTSKNGESPTPNCFHSIREFLLFFHALACHLDLCKQLHIPDSPPTLSMHRTPSGRRCFLRFFPLCMQAEWSDHHTKFK